MKKISLAFLVLLSSGCALQENKNPTPATVSGPTVAPTQSTRPSSAAPAEESGETMAPTVSSSSPSLPAASVAAASPADTPTAGLTPAGNVPGHQTMAQPSPEAQLAASQPAISPTPSANGNHNETMAQPSPIPRLVASEISNGLSIGVGYPYVGVKYYFNNDFGVEARFANGEGIDLYSGRGYWSFARFNDFRLLAGLDAGYIDFTSTNVNNVTTVTGNGYEVSPFCGAEYFIARELSCMVDFAMPFIGLNQSHTSITDLEWVLNAGVYVYPF